MKKQTDGVILDETWTYYTIQHKRTHESSWLEPNGPLTKVVDKNWTFSSWDCFGLSAEPWHGSGNDWLPKYREAHGQTYDVWSKTGHRGWWDLKYAIKGLNRLKADQAKGLFDYKDGYNKVHQAVRYKFRIVKMTVSKKIEEVSLEDAFIQLVHN